MALILRDYAATDADAVWHVHSEAIKADAGQDADVSWAPDLRAVEAEFVQTGGVFVVAVLDDAVVGIGGLRKLGAREAELARMRVLPTAQGAGVGRQLCAELITRAVALGFTCLVLETPSDAVPARRLYEHAGFTSIGMHHVHGMDMVKDQKALG